MKDLCTYYANIVDVGTLDISYTYIPEHKMQSYDEATVASCVEIDSIMFKGVDVSYIVDLLDTDFVNDLEIDPIRYLVSLLALILLLISA